jgi:hypothetical protein
MICPWFPEATESAVMSDVFQLELLPVVDGRRQLHSLTQQGQHAREALCRVDIKGLDGYKFGLVSVMEGGCLNGIVS